MKPEDIKAALDEYEHKVGLPTNRCQTGEAYQGFLVGGAESKDQALERLRDELLAYVADKAGIIYWRRDPYVSEDTEGGGWRAACRMVISSQPARYPDLEALQSARTFGDPLLPRVNQ
jgi:hypothetical protein